MPRRTSLRIFLSHKLESREKARLVAGALSAFGGERVLVSYSGNYPAGTDWENKIRTELDRSDWLILLYDGPDINHDWCLFETGFFRARMTRSREKRRLICLHDPRHNLPNPLRTFIPVPARQEEILNLFKDIYTRSPWNIKRDLLDFREQLDDQIKRIISEVTGGVELQSVTTISPSFAFHVKRELLDGLENGLIPDDTYVDGDGGWEKIFGKPVNTISWRWGDLAKGLLDSTPWVYLIALMMSEAHRLRAVNYPSTVIRAKNIGDNAQVVYRLILRRVEVTKTESRFFFAASPIVTPFDPSVIEQETTVFHMYNMAWFFRRRFFGKHLRELDGLLDTKPLPAARLEQATASISSDLKAIWADAQVRGLEDQSAIIDSYDSHEQPAIKKALQEDWPPLADKLNAHLKKGIDDAARVSQVLHQMKPINRLFLKASLMELQKFIPTDLAEMDEQKVKSFASSKKCDGNRKKRGTRA
jgi:hypothetical protein